MKRAIANFFLGIAICLGAKPIQVIKERYSDSTADAIFTCKPEWVADDAAAVDIFLKSQPGQNFSKRLRAVAATVAINGAMNTSSTVHAAGVSAGWNECVRYIHSLSRVSGVQDIKQDSEQAPQDEASLLEQLSP